MPELPEVEVLARHLDQCLRGRRVERVEVPRLRAIRPHAAAELASALEGAVIGSVGRRAKYLVWTARVDRQPGGERRWLVHLGMTGRVLVRAPGGAPIRHAAVVLRLDGMEVVFEDPRGFGRWTIDDHALAALGPEPLADDFTPETLREALKTSRQAVKVRLLDQAALAGVGNIYASEALFRAGISPRRRAASLKRADVARLWAAVRAVLGDAIRFGGTLPLDFTGDGRGDGLFYHGLAGGASPGYEERLRVYDRAGEPCLACGTPIRKWIQAARSTYYCPRCQR